MLTSKAVILKIILRLISFVKLQPDLETEIKRLKNLLMVGEGRGGNVHRDGPTNNSSTILLRPVPFIFPCRKMRRTGLNRSW